MDDAALEDLRAFLPPLLRALEGLGFVARRLNPPQLAQVLAVVAEPQAGLAEVRPRLADWPDDLAGVRERLESVADEALAAYRELGEAADMRAVYRGLRHLPRAQEALYPLAAGLPPVSRYFLTPARRDDAERLARLAAAPERDDVGVFHVDDGPGSRGGFSLYVPETYDGTTPHPVVFALHGGAGSGRGFLWSWLRDARSRGAILIAPTATGPTWALMGEDTDTPNLMRMLETVRGRYNVDAKRMLITGLSDGGTFCWVSGLDRASPFTHLAPVAATFHPLMAEIADAKRLRGLPIFLVHGRLDWMFPVQVARQTSNLLSAAGAEVTYREIDDLSHCYPREMNAEILRWLNGT
jgi:phospholipase/carboxylesterase